MAIYSELSKKSATFFFSAKEFEKYLDKATVFDTPMIIDDLHTISSKYHETIVGIIDKFLVLTNQYIFFNYSIITISRSYYNSPIQVEMYVILSDVIIVTITK